MFASNIILSVLIGEVFLFLCMVILLNVMNRKDSIPVRERILLFFGKLFALDAALPVKSVIQSSIAIYTLPCSCIGGKLRPNDCFKGV